MLESIRNFFQPFPLKLILSFSNLFFYLIDLALKAHYAWSPQWTLSAGYRTLEGGASFSESWSKVEAFGDGVIKSMTMSIPSAVVRDARRTLLELESQSVFIGVPMGCRFVP